MLAAAGVRCLVDVRRHPGSRKHPHFGRAALESELPARGIVYVFRGDELGGRRKKPPGDAPSRHPAWENASFRNYADYTDTPAFRSAIEELERLEPKPLAVMCAETAWWRCHRRLIADTLAVRGHEVLDLLDARRATPHPPNAEMRVGRDGWPVWDYASDA